MEFILAISVGDRVYALGCDCPCAGGEFSQGYCIDFTRNCTADRLDWYYRHSAARPICDPVLSVVVVLAEEYDGRFWVVCSNPELLTCSIVWKPEVEERVVKWLRSVGFERVPQESMVAGGVR